MGRKRALIAGKHLIYCFGLIFCYVLQTTPGFLQIFGVKPFLVIPAVIAIAMQEGEFTGALYGALGGMLCDMGANTFYGFYRRSAGIWPGDQGQPQFAGGIHQPGRTHSRSAPEPQELTH